jgi:hypothetical protein
MSRKLDDNVQNEDLCPDCGQTFCTCDESWLVERCQDIETVTDVTELRSLEDLLAHEALLADDPSLPGADPRPCGCASGPGHALDDASCPALQEYEVWGITVCPDCGTPCGGDCQGANDPDDEPNALLDRNYENALAILASAPAPASALDIEPNRRNYDNALRILSQDDRAEAPDDQEVQTMTATAPTLADEFFSGLAKSHAEARCAYSVLMTRIERRIESGKDAQAHALVEPRVVQMQDEQKALDLASHFTLTTTQPPWLAKGTRRISALDARIRSGRCVCDLYPAQHRIEELREELAEPGLTPLESFRKNAELTGWYKARATWQDETCPHVGLHLADELLDGEGFAATHSLDPIRDIERMRLDDSAILAQLHYDAASDEWMEQYAEDAHARREALIARRREEFIALAETAIDRAGMTHGEEDAEALLTAWNTRLEERIAQKGDELKGIASAIYAVQKAWGIEPTLDASERYVRSYNTDWQPTPCKAGRLPRL